MQVFQDTVAGIIANGILPRTAPIVYAMYEVMRQEESDGTGYSRFINRIQQRFKIQAETRHAPLPSYFSI